MSFAKWIFGEKFERKPKLSCELKLWLSYTCMRNTLLETRKIHVNLQHDDTDIKACGNSSMSILVIKNASGIQRNTVCSDKVCDTVEPDNGRKCFHNKDYYNIAYFNTHEFPQAPRICKFNKSIMQ